MSARLLRRWGSWGGLPLLGLSRGLPRLLLRLGMGLLLGGLLRGGLLRGGLLLGLPRKLPRLRLRLAKWGLLRGGVLLGGLLLLNGLPLRGLRLRLRLAGLLLGGLLLGGVPLLGLRLPRLLLRLAMGLLLGGLLLGGLLLGELLLGGLPLLGLPRGLARLLLLRLAMPSCEVTYKILSTQQQSSSVHTFNVIQFKASKPTIRELESNT